MASQKVEIIIIGKDELTSILKKAVGDLKEFGNASEDAGNKQEKLQTKTIAAGTFLGNIYEKAARKATDTLKELARQAIDVSSAYEQQQTTLEVLVGDQKTAREELEKWNQMSLKTPFTPAEWKESGIQLKAFGFELEQIPKFLEAAGNAASSFQGKVSLSQITDALGRLKAGQFGEAFQQFQRIGISMEVLKGEGLTFDKGGQYTGSVEQALSAVQNAIQTKFGGVMEKQAETFAGRMSTLQGHWEDFLKALMDSSGVFDWLKNRIGELSNLIGELSDYVSGRVDELNAASRSMELTQAGKSEEIIRAVKAEYEKLGGAWTEFNAKMAYKDSTARLATIQQEAKQNDLLAAAMKRVTEQRHKENADYLTSVANSKKAAEALKALQQGADEAAKAYEQMHAEFEKLSIENLNAEYENLRKIQEEVNSGALSLSAGGLERLKQQIIAVGSELNKLTEDEWGEFFDEFITKTPKFKPIDTSTLTSGMKTGMEEVADEAANVYDEISRWAGAIGNALSALGLMDDDMAALIEGVQGAATGVAKIATGDLTGIIDVIASLPSLFDGLTESFSESFSKQWEAQGFDDTLSQELIDKMEKASDAGGGKEFGMRAYIEDIFKEVDISNADEFTRLGDLLNEQMGAELAAGKTVEEVYAKYGDELQELIDAQEQYGFETTAALDQMVKLQREQTSAGRVGGISEAIGGIQNMIDAMSEYGYSSGSFTAVFGLLQSTFEKLRAEGLSTEEIFEKISPAVESAKKAAEAAGVSTQAMDDLLKFYEMMEASAPLFDVISGIDAALKGLAETGTLTQGNLDALSQTTLETYKNMQAEGFSPDQIAAAMGTSVLELAEAAEKYGFTLSGEMQDLINKMTAEGAETTKTDAEILQEWGDEFLGVQKAWGDQMIETFRNMGAYQEGGVVPGGTNQAALAWLHGGETVIPAGFTPATAGGGGGAAQRPVVNITFTGDSAMLRDFIKTHVEDLSAHGDLTIRESSIV